ncbi:MAG: hypothetical protein AAGG51_27050 [Cyanobacteria bacterium P01_G01_bin.54]
MVILVANVGTSDIALKTDEYYLPLFERQEPNLEQPDPATPEGAAWHRRQKLLGNMAHRELGTSVDAKFREVCQALLKSYQQDPETWHSRISIGRIWGVIQSALAAEEQVHTSRTLMQAYLVVTDQPASEIKGYPNDTVYAFGIIQAWLARQHPELVTGEGAPLSLVNSKIEFPAIDEDRLYEHYFHLFEGFGPAETLYLSVKGGTAQMQQALKVQALASNTKAQIFLSPKPQVSKILAGQPSDCQRVAYWRYQQNQRYQTVQLLLDRWDFDGAVSLLQGWDKTLQATVSDDREELQKQRSKVLMTLLGLKTAADHMNLDTQSAKESAAHVSDIQALLRRFDNLSENLYAQCKIYFELGRISHFLSHLGSFCDVTQKDLIEKLNSQFPEDVKRGNRYRKREFIKDFFTQEGASKAIDISAILENWGKLDFWYNNRNYLIHGAKGINKSRLKEVYEDRFRELKKKSRNERRACQLACSDANILPTMQGILHSLNCIGQSTRNKTDLWGDPDYFGLYGEIRDWAIATLTPPSSS